MTAPRLRSQNTVNDEPLSAARDPVTAGPLLAEVDEQFLAGGHDIIGESMSLARGQRP